MRVLLLLCILIVGASAHSWLDCSNWKLKDPSGYTTASAARFADADGTCEGYARRFEVGIKPFGKMDEVQFYRHYVQGTSNLACRRNAGTTSNDGSNEGPASPRSLAYAANKSPLNQVWGKMAQVYPGDPICWRWPAKNHMAHVNVATNMVLVYWDSVPGRTADISQSDLAAQGAYAQLPFANCPVAGPPSNGDQTGVGSELRPCGGCFTVPNRAAGIYTVQWNWPFKANNAETYTSCADIEILAAGNVDCVVSAWSSYSACSSDCGGGTQTRTRAITTARQGTGAACATPLTESQVCNTGACTYYISEHVVYDDALRGFDDWSWAATYSLLNTATKHSGTYGISWTPKTWDAVYLHYPGGGDIKDYQRISFWIHGGTTGGQSIWFSVVTAGASTSTSLFDWQVPTASIKANQWTQVNLTFASLGKTSGYFDGIWFQAYGDGVQGTVYIDDIYFMHMHQGGQAPTPVDLCASVTCGSNSVCSGGSCICTNGYSATAAGACTVAPSITNVVVKSLAGVTLTTFTGGETVVVSWTSTGTLATISVTLESSVSTIPTVIASQVNNAGSLTFVVPTALAAATYYVRVSYSNSVTAKSSGLSKTTTPVVICTDEYCSGHGVCNEDTSGLCVCRYGYNGTLCLTPPKLPAILRLSGNLVVSSSYTTYTSSPSKFASVFRSDLASALLITTDQVEVTRVVASGSGSKVSFDVLFGGLFPSSSLSLTTAAALTATLSDQLENSDSSLNRGTNTYSSDVSAAPHMASTNGAIVITITALFATIVARLF